LRGGAAADTCTVQNAMPHASERKNAVIFFI
jgi:hypothetical protein